MSLSHVLRPLLTSAMAAMDSDVPAIPPQATSIPSPVGHCIQHSAPHFGAYLSGHEEHSSEVQGG